MLRCCCGFIIVSGPRGGREMLSSLRLDGGTLGGGSENVGGIIAMALQAERAAVLNPPDVPATTAITFGASSSTIYSIITAKVDPSVVVICSDSRACSDSCGIPHSETELLEYSCCRSVWKISIIAEMKCERLLQQPWQRGSGLASTTTVRRRR